MSHKINPANLVDSILNETKQRIQDALNVIDSDFEQNAEATQINMDNIFGIYSATLDYCGNTVECLIYADTDDEDSEEFPSKFYVSDAETKADAFKSAFLYALRDLINHGVTLEGTGGNEEDVKSSLESKMIVYAATNIRVRDDLKNLAKPHVTVSVEMNESLDRVILFVMVPQKHNFPLMAFSIFEDVAEGGLFAALDAALVKANAKLAR